MSLFLQRLGFDDVRVAKRTELLRSGVDPYPYSFPDRQPIASVRALAQQFHAEGAPSGITIRIAGRVWARRAMGRTRFVDIRDGSDKIQLYFRRDSLATDAWRQLELLDLGDIIGVDGELFRTRTGELSVRVSSFAFLAKALVPLPIGKETGEQTYYRLSDAESRYRERYLTWLLDSAQCRRIRMRSQIIAAVRRHMDQEGFLEVSTPTIEPVYGGAEARPFRTSIWALSGAEWFLRISPELYLKRYLVAGFDRVYTICQNFRNEGIDHSHNPEFTMMEWYEAYTDYDDQMRRFETMVAAVCSEVTGSTRISYQGTEIEFRPPWRRLTMLDALRELGGIDAANMSLGQLQQELTVRAIETAGVSSWGLAVVELFGALCEQKLVQPTFVIDHPIEICPLTKAKRGDSRLAERFEPFVSCMEIGNAYSELTDPVDQFDRFEAQRLNRRANQEYVDHPLDSDFLKAMGVGMPPTGGVGVGVDRLIMLLTDAASIRDVIPFPMVRPRAFAGSGPSDERRNGV